MTGLEGMWHVVLPQAVKLMLPSMGGVYVIIIKGTSIISVIRIAELVRAGEHAALRRVDGFEQGRGFPDDRRIEPDLFLDPQQALALLPLTSTRCSRR